VEFKYTPWGQVGQDRQAHSGAAGSGTPSVTYGFRTNGSAHANDINPLWMITPSTHMTNYLYGTGDTDNHKLGRIESLRVGGESSDLVTYKYCGLDRFVKVVYARPGVDLSYIIPGGDAGDPYGGWDRFGRTQDMPWARGATILERALYGYNEGSQRTWREAPVAPSDEDECYQYDDLYQLIGRQRGNLNVNRTAIGGVPVRNEEFDYDPIGNWQGYDVWQSGTKTLDQSRVHNTSNILTQIDGSSSLLAHDTAGNMTKCPPPEDGSWSHAQELKWDAWNRLMKVKVPGGATIAEYAYDGLARRTTKKVAGKVTHYYYNRQWRPVEEREGSSEKPSCIYDWGLRYRDDLVRRTKWTGGHGSSGSSGSESSSPVSSGSGSGSGSGLVKLVNYALHDYYNVTAITDEYGSVVERYGYSGFGDVRFMTAGYVDRGESAYEWDLLYKAQFRDSETGYYNYGFRYYVPLLGRWINRDPIGYKGGVNLYTFVANNGANGTDLLGLKPGSVVKHKAQDGFEIRLKEVNSAVDCPGKVTILIGGFMDESTKVARNTIPYDVYAPWDDQKKVESFVNELRKCCCGTMITIIGHSWGADTALDVVRNTDAGFHQLITVDAVSRGKNKDREKPENVGIWSNVYQPNEVGPLLSDNGVARVGGHWGEIPGADENVKAPDDITHGMAGGMFNLIDASISDTAKTGKQHDNNDENNKVSRKSINRDPKRTFKKCNEGS